MKQTFKLLLLRDSHNFLYNLRQLMKVVWYTIFMQMFQNILVFSNSPPLPHYAFVSLFSHSFIFFFLFPFSYFCWLDGGLTLFKLNWRKTSHLFWKFFIALIFLCHSVLVGYETVRKNHEIIIQKRLRSSKAFCIFYIFSSCPKQWIQN